MTSLSSAELYPLAASPPMMDPMLVPTMPAMGMPSSSRTSRTPMWASPRVPPPERARTTPPRAEAGPAAKMRMSVRIAVAARFAVMAIPPGDVR